MSTSSPSSVSSTLSLDGSLKDFDFLLVLLDLILHAFSCIKFRCLTGAFSGFLTDTLRRLSYHSAYCSRLLIICYFVSTWWWIKTNVNICNGNMIQPFQLSFWNIDLILILYLKFHRWWSNWYKTIDTVVKNKSQYWE